MLHILADWFVFAALIGGLGLPLTASLPFAADDRVTLGAVAGCLVVYLAAWTVYWCSFPAGVFGVLLIAAGVACVLRRRPLRLLMRDSDVRRMLALWLILTAWCLGLLTLIRSYSGGEWVGDWIEHYDRTRFFLEHRPLDTLFLQQYPLPARPPLANLVSGAFMALTGMGFAQFQIFSTLLASLAFFPAVLLARRFARGADPAATVLVLLMLSPLFVQNATFAWTKLPAAFFTLSGLVFFLRADCDPAGLSLRCAAVCLVAALLTHYSAAPYLLVLVAAWFIQRRAVWRQSGFWHDLLYPVAIVVLLLSTWLVWSTWHYGVATTFLSNTAVAGNEGLTLAQQLARRAVNLFNTLVPHPLRPAEYAYVQQASALSWWRDYFFNIYQTNLPFAFGSGGVVALMALVWRRRREITAFWVWFTVVSVLLNIAATSWPDRWGAAHIGLQPLIILGLAWLAANLPTLGRGLRAWLGVGLTLDFCLGIAGHFWLQHLEFPADMFVTHRDHVLRDLHGYTAWNNFLSKCALHLSFLGDLGVSMVLLGALLAMLLSLALWYAFQSAARCDHDG